MIKGYTDREIKEGRRWDGEKFVNLSGTDFFEACELYKQTLVESERTSETGPETSEKLQDEMGGYFQGQMPPLLFLNEPDEVKEYIDEGK
jgi:hypothetical protein